MASPAVKRTIEIEAAIGYELPTQPILNGDNPSSAPHAVEAHGDQPQNQKSGYENRADEQQQHPRNGSDDAGLIDAAHVGEEMDRRGEQQGESAIADYGGADHRRRQDDPHGRERMQ